MPALIFMDIELTDGNCFEIFNRININTPIIFTTAYDNYLFKAFKVNSVDYLLKPIMARDVEAGIRKFERNMMALDHKVIKELQATIHYRDRILISTGDIYKNIRVSDIAYFISEDKYIFAITFNGSKHITSFPNLTTLYETLDQHIFFHIARNTIVHLQAISAVSKYFSGRLKVTRSEERRVGKEC